MNRVRMVKHFGITPYLVFDGGYLPSKAITEDSRRKRREECKKVGFELLKAGKPAQAHAELQKAIDVTPEMARHLIEELKKANIPYVVAPYEADPQLVYLERQGHISGIISEDSDLLVFGAKRLLTKLDQYGKCIEINRRDFCACREVSLTGWTDAQFRQMAILSGCDYLDSINNMGLKTAHRMMRKHKTPERVVRMLQFDGKYRVPADYLTQFHQAEQTFLHQWVFCPKTSGLVNFTAPGPDLKADELPFIGSFLEPDVARGVAIGDLNPVTKQKIVLDALPSPRKRTASVAAHVAPQPRTTRETQGPKPIDSYFKGHRRIPLGEMEPNCFVVEPTRLSNMTDNGNRSIVYPLPRPYIAGSNPISTGTRPYINRPESSPRTLRRRTEPVTNLLSNGGRSLVSEPRRQTIAPQINPTNSNSESAETASHVRPPKKARLCDDASSGLSPNKRKSKFFSPGKKGKSIKKGEGYLKSDDSIEDLLQDLPDFGGWNSGKGQKEVAVYQETYASTNTKNSKDDEKDDNGPCESPTSTNDGVPPNTPSIADRFAYTSSATSDSSTSGRSQSRVSSVRSSLTDTPASSIASSAQFSSYTQPSTAKTTPATTRMTPLQRLGIQALGRSKQPSTPTFAVPRPPKRSSLGRPSLDSIPVNPAFVPLPPVDLAEVEALHDPVGSEDLMIPESESDEAVEGQEGLGSGKGSLGGRKLDLSRFLFA